MKTVDLVKDRYGRAKNMLVQSKRGLAWGHNSLANQDPLPERTETTDLEMYVDAHETGRGIWKWQHYLPIYERHLEKFRGREVHVVEIGVYSGGSLDMWKEYFGPKSHIYGVDIGPECKAYERPGIDIFIGDQADPALWKRFLSQVPQIDVVIDDGGHQMFQQIATLEALLPHIRPGGAYVCEDVHGEYNPFLDYVFGLSRGLHARPPGARAMRGTPPTDLQLALDSFHFYPFVTVIEKRSHQVDQLIAPKRGTEWDPTHVGRRRA